MEEKRKFTRIIFSTPAQLLVGNLAWDVELIDLSLIGALVTQPEGWALSPGGEYQLEFTLSGSDIAITMDVDIAHATEGLIGLHCSHVDIDSASHLRRLIELNVGNDELLQRELTELSRPDIT